MNSFQNPGDKRLNDKNKQTKNTKYIKTENNKFLFSFFCKALLTKEIIKKQDAKTPIVKILMEEKKLK